MLDNNRNGNFTSSEIVLLLSEGTAPLTEEELAARPKKGKGSSVTTKPFGLGKSAITYIEECNMERRFVRNLNIDAGGRPLIWGKVGEYYVFNNILGTNYVDGFTNSVQHPTIPYWWGTPDAGLPDTEVEIKCPSSMKSFYELVSPTYKPIDYLSPVMRDGEIVYEIVHNALTIEAVRANHSEGEKYYWQVVSNATIRNKSKGQLIIFMPYKKELPAIRNVCANWHGDQNKVAWINFADDAGLPHIPDECQYSNVNIIDFEIPQVDKDYLTARVQLAGKFLINK